VHVWKILHATVISTPKETNEKILDTIASNPEGIRAMFVTKE